MKAVFAILCASLMGGPALLQQSQLPVFRGGTQVVTIDVSVQQKNTPVTGLTARDFELLDNGTPQVVELRAMETVPIDVSVVFDQNYFAQQTIGADFASDLKKIAETLRPIDRLRVITFARSVREALPLQSQESWSGRRFPDLQSPLMAEVVRRHLPADRSGFDLRHDPELRQQALFDALLLALALPPQLGRRHLIVAFCLTADKGSVAMDGDLLQAVASRTEALLHLAIWNRRVMDYTLEGLGGEYTRLALTGAAEATGGDVHLASNGVSAFKSIFADFRKGYTLNYTVTGVALGGWHTVSVKTPAFPNYEVKARRGYLGR